MPTTAAHAAQDRRRRDPPATTPSRGPERVRRGASPAPLPRRGPAAGTMSPVLGRPPRAPRSRPVNPGAKAPGMGKGTTASGKPTSAPRATGPDEAGRPRGATRHAREARRRPQPRHTYRCQATTAAGCRRPGQRAPQPHNHGRGATPKGRRGQAAPERPDVQDWIVRGGPSSTNRRHPDCSIQGPEAVDAQDRIIRGGTSSGRHGEPERRPRGRGRGDAAKRSGGQGRGEAEKTR